jgi:electron transfer flavoprotein beta subunit
MKLLVPIKQSAQLDDDFELRDDGRGVDPDFLEHDLNEWDAFSLEEALLLRERAGSGEVVVVTVGDEEAQDALLAGLAKGADRGVHIELEGDAAGDPLAVARLLAEVVKREQPSLVLCGVQSSDSANGATGTALAAFAGLPRVAVVRSVEWDGRGPATVERELEGGLVERQTVRTPAVLTIQTGGNEPRYANLRAIKQAREKPMERLAAGDLLADGEPGYSRVVSLAKPPAGRGAEMLDGDAVAVSRRIATIVKAAGVGS